MPILCKCLECGKEFYKYPYDIKKGKGKYCSKKCMYKASRERGGNFHPMLKFRGEIGPNDWWKVQK